MPDNPARRPAATTVDAVARLPKLTEIVADMLRRQIITGELAQGAYLPPEAELMVQLGVSRPTLREALRVLESEKLIRPRRGSRSGAQVQAPSVELSSRYMGLVLQYERVTLEDVHRARCTVEPALAGILAARRDPDALAQLRQLLEQEEACLDDHVAYAHASVRFHERIADLAGVQTLAMCVRQFNWVLERFFAGEQQPPARNALSHRAHAHFLELLASASPSEVEGYWRNHCEAVGEFMLKGHEGERVLDLFS